MMDASPGITNFRDDAGLGALVEALQPHAGSPLVLHYGDRTVAAGYHVTEVKTASFAALDCGGSPDRWSETVLQVEDIAPVGAEGHMRVGKFLAILDRVAAHIPLVAESRLTFEIGRAGEAMQVFDVGEMQASSDAVLLRLAPRAAICKPRHRAAAAAAVPCCTPAAGPAGTCCAPSAA